MYKEILPLNDCQEFLPIIARWCSLEWPSEYNGGCLEKAIDSFSNMLNTNKIPLCLVALINSKPVGTISILEYDMDIRKNYSPWIGNLSAIPGQN